MTLPAPPPASTVNTPSQQRMTYKIQWIRDAPYLPNPDNCVELWAVRADGTKVLVRATQVSYLLNMRKENCIPEETTDLEFIALGILPHIEKMGFSHMELGFGPMETSKRGGKQVSFTPEQMEGMMK